MRRVTLRDWGLSGEGLACTAPLPLLGEEGVACLTGLAERLDREVGFSRETPARIRGVQHLAPEALRLLGGVGVLDRLSAEAGEPLRLHPSAHFGCSFNRTRDSGEGLADPWHLDAAPYTLVLLLSSPGTGGELCIHKGEPCSLWRSLDGGEGADGRNVHAVPFRNRGEAVLFQGRRLAHSVRALRGEGAERLTLAVGLYSPGHPERGLLPGGEAPGDEELFWRVEALRARVLASLDRLRRQVAWVADPAVLPDAAGRLATMLGALEEAERAESAVGKPALDGESRGKG
jgi:hypothetical protein